MPRGCADCHVGDGKGGDALMPMTMKDIGVQDTADPASHYATPGK